MLLTALIAPALMGAVAVGVDYTIFFNQKSALQQAADAAALASVKELSLSGTTEDLVKQVGKSYAENSFLNGNEVSSVKGDFVADILPSTTDREVVVNLSYEWSPFLAQIFDYRVTPIQVTATAGLAGRSLTCIIGLMPPQSGWIAPKASIHLDNEAVVEAERCAVFSNSTSRYGLRADGDSAMSASTICSAGGVYLPGNSATFEPDPIRDCPKIEDPLLDRMPPSVGACDFTNKTISSDQVLRKGVYCGGLTLSGNARVTMEPGTFIIKDGPLIVSDNVELSGSGITFFLTGENSVFDFQENTSIDLVAAETGSGAGLLFFEDRNVPHSFSFNPFYLESLPEDVRVHRISSNDARNLLGTIYLSKSVLLIDSNAPVADASAYTAIVTGRLWLQAGPILTLNADLTDTKVPVPDGLLGTEPVLSN